MKLRCDGCGIECDNRPGGPYSHIQPDASAVHLASSGARCTGHWRAISASSEERAQETSTFERLKGKLAEPGRNGVIKLEPAATPAPLAAETRLLPPGECLQHEAEISKVRHELATKRDECGRLERQLAEALNERDMANREAAALNQQRIRLEDRLRRAETERR